MLPCPMINVAIYYGKTLTVQCTNYNYKIQICVLKNKSKLGFSIDYFGNAMTSFKAKRSIRNDYQLEPLEVIINKNN